MIFIDNRQSDIGIWSFNFETNSGTWRHKLLKILEIPENFEFTTETLIDFYTEGCYRTKVKSAFDTAINNGEHFFLDAEITTAKGNKKAVRTIGYADMKNGKCRKFFVIVHDITNGEC